MPAAEAEAFVAARPANYDDRSVIAKYGDAVLAGDIRIEDIADRTHIEFVQDYVVQVGQGGVENRRHEVLGRTDAMVVLQRRIWRRELEALAEGRPLKQWRLPPDLEPTATVDLEAPRRGT
jgi:5,5'-dehydrodivanillate O-demethylase